MLDKIAEQIEKYLDTKSAARWIKVSPRTLETWRRHGIGPRCVRAGQRRVLYAAEDLARFVDRTEVVSDPETEKAAR